ncbi:MAG: 7TM diverse intracellular signaling domain-containing protein [Bdellovibrionota bacterium]|nr:7TM diverse intracellular signaling domain-containing protein [Bdellovibrionota bacterium]
MRITLFFVLFILSQLIYVANADGALLLNEGQETLNIDARQIDVLEDPKGSLKIEDMKRPEILKRFKKHDKKVLGFGFTKSSIWIKLPVQNKSSIKNWVLNINFPDLDEIILYKKNNKGQWEKAFGGDIFSADQWEFKYKDYIFNLSEEEVSTYFLNVKSQGAITIPLQIMTKDSFFKLRGKSRLFFGGFFSILIFMIIYNIIIAFFLKSKPFFYYVGFLGSVAWMTSVLSGVGRSVLLPNGIWFSNEGFVFSLLSFFFFFLLFTKEFIGVEKKYIILNKFYVISCYCIGAFFLIAPFGSLSFNLNIIAGAALPAMSTAIFTGFYFFKKKREARFYIYSFLLVILGGITKALSALGIAPSSFVIENGIFLGFLIQVALLSLGLADVINTLLKKTIEAEGKLVEANKSLEDKVDERTADLSAALGDISNLLNNMRQAVFTADQNGTILSPVSIFSEVIFEDKIENKKIDDTLFKGIDKKSEVFSTIQFSYSHIFGADDLQWEMVKDHFPRKVTYISSDGQEKILQVTYTPLWDQNNLLNRVMFIVEDITEIEKLEKEMEEQKSTSLKNIQILQELASNNKDDLNSFFSKTNRTALDALYLAKKMRSQVNKNQDFDELHLFFRHLHSIKGNARIFNLGFISTYSHKTESDLIDIIEKNDQNEAITYEELNHLVQGMYDLQGQINEYLKAAKSVFSLEFDEDKKFKEKLHDLVKNLEHWFSQLCVTSAEDPTKKITALKEGIQIKDPYRGKIFEELKNLAHSLKGLSRGMDEREISEEVHFFEGGMSLFQDSTENLSLEDFNKYIIEPIKRIKSLSLSMFIRSKQLKVYETSPVKWSYILEEVYEMNHLIKNNDLKGVSQKIYNIHVKMATLGIEFLPGTTRLLYSIFQEKRTDTKITHHIMKKSWEYLVFTCSLDNNHIYSIDERSNIIKTLTEGQQISSLDFLEKESIFLTFLKRMDQKGILYPDLLSELSDILEIDYETLIKDIFPKKDYKTIGADLFYELKKSFNLNSVETIERLHKNDETFFLNFKKWFCQEDDLGIDHYLKRIDIIQTLNTFCVTIDVSEKWLKPRTYDVLIENYNECFEDLLNKAENDQKIDLNIINRTFEKLVHLPIKHSFYKFSSVVEEVSKALGKKINFRIMGDQGGLEKERLNLLQDVMVHLVRNSIDHGIEPPSQRIANGKDQMGTIQINCHQLNSEEFQIRLKDDGNGIDTHKVVQKSLEKGHINSAKLKNMSDEDKLNLIFLPNLSTKENVSEISGRGVGMEIVKNNLKDLGASLDIKTFKGEGTEFIININLVK